MRQLMLLEDWSKPRVVSLEARGHIMIFHFFLALPIVGLQKLLGIVSCSLLGQ